MATRPGSPPRGSPIWGSRSRGLHWPHGAYRDGSGVPHDVRYSDGPAVGDRVELARARGLKVGFWRVGQEDERIWSDPRMPVGE